MDFLPFWCGGLALGGVAVWTWVVEGRTIGVTGEVTRIVNTITDPEAEREAQEFAQRAPADVLAALAAATAAEMGKDIEDIEDVEEIETSETGPEAEPLDIQRHVPITHRALFLLFIALGAAVASLSDGTLELRWDFGEVHTALVGGGWSRYLVLLGGGIAVGFGTRMAGGCTSGHGLSGCARMLPRSLVATATFLAAAILFTLATKALS